MIKDRFPEILNSLEVFSEGTTEGHKVKNNIYNDIIVEHFYADIQEICGMIEKVQTAIVEVEKRHEIILTNLSIYSASDFDDIRQEIENFDQEIMGTILEIKRCLREIKNCTNEFHTNAVDRIRLVQSAYIQNLFLEILASYFLGQSTNLEKYKEDFQEKLRMIGKDKYANDEDYLDRIFNPASLPLRYSSDILLKTEQVENDFSIAETRHADIKTLEASVRRIRNIFVRMHSEWRQKENLDDNIVYVLENTHEDLETDHRRVRRFFKYQKRKLWRRNFLPIFVPVLFLFVIIAFVLFS